MSNSSNIASRFFEMAQLLRGCYALSEYYHVIFPLIFLRRLDCLQAPSKEAVISAHQQLSATLTGDALEAALNDIAGLPFHNHSPLTLQHIRNAPREVHLNLQMYIGHFSTNVQSVLQHLGFKEQVTKLQEANLLFLVLRALCEIDLGAAAVSDGEMAEVFDQTFCHFSKISEEHGEHATPPDVAQLLIRLLFAPDAKQLATEGTSFSVFDPVCGMGGLLLEARKQSRQGQAGAELSLHGQEYNVQSWAIATAKLLAGSDSPSFAIHCGNSLADDQFQGQQFDYLCATPSWGAEWKKIQPSITQEHQQQGFAGRFGAGLPRTNDATLLFLQHMLAKFKPANEGNPQAGSRMAMITHASPLFTGDAGSGESKIRKWIIENDWLEAIVALPPGSFYNTSIGTYVWLLTNRKTSKRRGKIQLIDARENAMALPRSTNNKRREFNQEQISAIVHNYIAMTENDTSKVFDNSTFGYSRVTVERPLRLAFQITIERKERFLNACPDLLDDLRRIERAIGYELHLDWNDVWQRIQLALGGGKLKWRMPQVKVFREIFTEVNQAAMPVIYRPGEMVKEMTQGLSIATIVGAGLAFGPVGAAMATAIAPAIAHESVATRLATGVRNFFIDAPFKSDPALRNDENVPLKQDLANWLEREVRPHAPDAWISPGNTIVGYEINFHRYFYNTPTHRPLAAIDADLKQVEERIANLLREVTA